MLTRLIPGQSVPAAGAENKKNKACDDRSNDDHPVLAIEAKKGKVLDQKVQRPRAPIFGAKISVTASEIYYFYIFIQQ
jgi:hypothetical protein